MDSPMRKKIGVVGTLRDDTFGVGAKYASFAAQFGDVIILTPDSPIMDLDLLILPGGADIDPARYGEKPGYELYRSDPYLEEFDRTQLPIYIEKTPIFGICRGMQTLWVHFGGKLNQHIKGHPTNLEDREEEVHTIYDQDTAGRIGEVNSMHHQSCVLPPSRSMPFHVEAVAHDDTIEAISMRHNGKIVVAGVQWHPEELVNCHVSNKLIKELIS